jgi:HSP20 family protein
VATDSEEEHMELYRWDPFTTLERLDRQFDEIVRRSWGTNRPAARTAGFVPPVEMLQDGGDVVVRLELPGIDPAEDIDVSVHEGRLAVSGERKETRTEAGQGLLVRELRYGSFRREFALPDGVTADDVEASYDKGLLELRIRQVVKPAPEPRRITISTGTDAPAVEAASAETIDGDTA